MAKPKNKTTVPVKRSRGRPKAPQSSREANIHIRGTQAWKDWLGRLAEHRQTDISTLVAQLSAEEATRIGFEAPPLRRAK